MTLYLSGPMTGLPDFNYPAFQAAKAALEARGYDVVSPADLPIRNDWDWVERGIPIRPLGEWLEVAAEVGL